MKWMPKFENPQRTIARTDRFMQITAVIVGFCGVADLLFLNAATAPGLWCIALLLWMQPVFRKNALRSGWLLGRSALLRSMHEAQRRGLSPEEWQLAEFERDVAVMRGAPILLSPDTDEPHDTHTEK